MYFLITCGQHIYLISQSKLNYSMSFDCNKIIFFRKYIVTATMHSYYTKSFNSTLSSTINMYNTCSQHYTDKRLLRTDRAVVPDLMPDLMPC